MTEERYDVIAVDAHVHLHACFDAMQFIETAYRNLAFHADRLRHKGHVLGMLLLTEGPAENGFSRLLNPLRRQESRGEALLGSWRIRDTEEDTSLYLTGGEKKLIVVAGQQISTQEQLEVLAIGTRQRFEEGLSIKVTLRKVAEAGALPVVPWGFGKWMGRRGELIKQLVSEEELPQFFVGDNANRPIFIAESSLFDAAKEEGIYNLPGSDPLPFPHECQRVGQAGFVLEENLDLAIPAQSLKKLLAKRSRPPRTFIQGETPLRFVRNQLLMQHRKFSRRRKSVA